MPVTVNFFTSDGAAKAGQDYDAKSGTITFAPGETSKTITIVVRGDRTFEGNQWFGVYLSGSIGALIEDGYGEGRSRDADRRGCQRVGSLVLAAKGAPDPFCPRTPVARTSE